MSAAPAAAPPTPAVIWLAFAAGTLCAGAAALWWLGAIRLALATDADTSRVSDQAWQSMWTARAMLLAVLGPRVGTWLGWRPSVTAGVVLLAPAWPLGVLIGSARAAAPAPALLAEGALLLAAIALPGLGRALDRGLRRQPLSDGLATLMGVCLALGFWHGRPLFF